MTFFASDGPKSPVCNRCGSCCFFHVNGVKHKCKYLVRLKNGKTLCRVFNRRDGKILYKEGHIIIRCNLRNNVPLNYPGCPYNKPGQPDANSMNTTVIE